MPAPMPLEAPVMRMTLSIFVASWCCSGPRTAVALKVGPRHCRDKPPFPCLVWKAHLTNATRPQCARRIQRSSPRSGSFRAAADRLGVTRSAVSQTIRQLEETLGTALVQRTTRSVSLTEAGERLHAEVAPAHRRHAQGAQKPPGASTGDRARQLRLAVSSIAERFLSGPLLAAFTEANPKIELYIACHGRGVRHRCGGLRCRRQAGRGHRAGHDRGAGLGRAAAARRSARRPISSASARPLIRATSRRHRCIGWRRAPKVAPYRWEFAEGGKEFQRRGRRRPSRPPTWP